MERSNLEIVILAAGHGSRMHSSTPKVLHNVAGQALLEYSIKIATDILESYKGTITVVASQELFDNIAFKALQERYFFSTVIQKEKLGTGDAVRAAFIDRVPITSTSILVLYGDTPLLKIETIHAMLASLYGDCGNHLVALGFKSESSSGYGRFILSKDNTLIKIIEAKDCNDDEVNVTICNGGIMAFTSEVLKKFIPQMRNDNKSSEYYLTNIVEFTNQNGYRNCYIVTDRDEILGVNDRSQLSEIEGIVQKRLRAKLLEKGVTLIAPETVFLTETVDIESDVIIHPYVYFGKDVKVKSAAEIFSFSHIEGAII